MGLKKEKAIKVERKVTQIETAVKRSVVKEKVV